MGVVKFSVLIILNFDFFVEFQEDGRNIKITMGVKLEINEKDPYANKIITEL